MHVHTCIIRFVHDTAKRSAIQGLSQKRSVRAVVFDYPSAHVARTSRNFNTHRLAVQILWKFSAKMTDPSHALESFQQALLHGGIQLQPGVLDREIHVSFDQPNGGSRFTYVRLEGTTVTAFVELAPCEPIDGTPCFSIGYAVPQAYRNQGRAKDAIRAALSEMQHGLGRIGLSVFYVEAIVEADNKPSQRVAEQVISDTPIAVTDQVSGLPAFQYVRRIGHPKAS
jgi:hypothetical protein